MAIYSIRHVTQYRYRRPVSFGSHRLMLRPRESHDQRTRHFSLVIDPVPRRLGWAEDASGNLVGSCSFGKRSAVLRFASELIVEQDVVDLSNLHIAAHAQTVPFSYGAEETPDLARFVERQFADPDHALDAWVDAAVGWSDRARGRGLDTWLFLTRLNDSIRREFTYLRRDEKGIQGPTETLRLRRGTCRDFAVLMCEAVRALGLAARYVSGYLRVHGHDGPNRAAGATHAWMQAYLPGAGWVDFDPTSGTRGNEGLIRVAAVRDPFNAIPLSGTFQGFSSDVLSMEVSVEVIEQKKREDVRAPAVPRLTSR